MHLPCRIGNYVDFFSSLEHATNTGRILRPGTEPLTPNWRHLPIGYHGRAGSIVVDGTPIRRPMGTAPDVRGPVLRTHHQARLRARGRLHHGAGTRAGRVGHHHRSRDLHPWIGAGERLVGSRHPGLGVTTTRAISREVIRHDDLAVGGAARRPGSAQGEAAGPGPSSTPLSHSCREGYQPGADRVDQRGGRDAIEPEKPVLDDGQQLAHATSNGATFAPGDLFASGTVSGSTPRSRGCLLELTSNGTEPITLENGQIRGYLEDGDTVMLSASAGGKRSRGSDSGPAAGRSCPPAVSARSKRSFDLTPALPDVGDHVRDRPKSNRARAGCGRGRSDLLRILHAIDPNWEPAVPASSGPWRSPLRSPAEGLGRLSVRCRDLAGGEGVAKSVNGAAREDVGSHGDPHAGGHCDLHCLSMGIGQTGDLPIGVGRNLAPPSPISSSTMNRVGTRMASFSFISSAASSSR